MRITERSPTTMGAKNEMGRTAQLLMDGADINTRDAVVTRTQSTNLKMAPGVVLCPVEAVGEVRTAGADTNE